MPDHLHDLALLSDLLELLPQRVDGADLREVL